MIWLFKINEVFWGNKPKVDEHYVFPEVDDIEFDITLYDKSLYMATANYFLLNDKNPDEIYCLQYSGKNSNPIRLSVGKNTDYYDAVVDYYNKSRLETNNRKL